MKIIETTLSEIPLLLNDFFQHHHLKKRLRVFLCGPSCDDKYKDIRSRIKRILERRMGCDSFLGEEIEELKSSLKASRDHLTIELREANNSDLVIMFLGSPGTYSELSAFALDEEINKKLLVFNSSAYKEEESFINLGPLKLLPRGNLIYYDEAQSMPSKEIIIKLDKFIARQWFIKHKEKYKLKKIKKNDIDFFIFITLSIVYASYPVRYKELTLLFPFPELYLRKSLEKLFNLKIIKKEENKYIPIYPMEKLILERHLLKSLAKVRLELLSKRMGEVENVGDYRVIL